MGGEHAKARERLARMGHAKVTGKELKRLGGGGGGSKPVWEMSQLSLTFMTSS